VEIISRIATPLNGNEPGLIAYYDFNEADEALIKNKATAYPEPLLNGKPKLFDPMLNWGDFDVGYAEAIVCWL